MRHALTAVLACVYAEFIGYVLHRLLHSGWVPWLTRRHLVHHLELYGPTMKLRTPVYRDRELGGIAGVGWEWIVPSVVLFVLELVVLNALGVGASTQVIISIGGLLWSVVMFYRAHEAMHVAELPWWLTGPLRGWFLRARRLHDIHHVAIDETGRNTCNFGVAFHGFDRLFGSHRSKVPSRPRPQLRVCDTGLVIDTTRPKWRAWVMPGLLTLGIAGAIGLAWFGARDGDASMRARCDLVMLEVRAPDLDSAPLEDAALRTLGGEAWAEILELCQGLDPYTKHMWRLRASMLTPRIHERATIGSGQPPAAVKRQAERACRGDYEAVGEVPSMRGRWRGYATFELCRLDAHGILSSSDVDYVDPGSLADWRIHQLLLEAEVPEPLAARYFTAILLALEIEERAPGRVHVHHGFIEVVDHDAVIALQDTPLDRPLTRERAPHSLDDALDFDSGCPSGKVSIAASEPIGHLRWLLEAEINPDRCDFATLTIAISEREQLLRPLRATLDVPVSGLGHPADVELALDSTSPDALAHTLATVQPSSVRVRASASTPASRVVDLLRVADVWAARNRREMKLWLVIEPDAD